MSIDRRAASQIARQAPAMRAAFWADKEINSLHCAAINKPGKLERAAMVDQGAWLARFDAARLTLIEGGKA